jgi:hypothetical protein
MKQDEVISMAFKAGKGDDDWIILLKQLFKHFPEEFNEFVRLLVEHERNEIIQILDDSTGYIHMDLIRERGQK